MIKFDSHESPEGEQGSITRSNSQTDKLRPEEQSTFPEDTCRLEPSWMGHWVPGPGCLSNLSA